MRFARSKWRRASGQLSSEADERNATNPIAQPRRAAGTGPASESGDFVRRLQISNRGPGSAGRSSAAPAATRFGGRFDAGGGKSRHLAGRPRQRQGSDVGGGHAAAPSTRTRKLGASASYGESRSRQTGELAVDSHPGRRHRVAALRLHVPRRRGGRFARRCGVTRSAVRSLGSVRRERRTGSSRMRLCVCPSFPQTAALISLVHVLVDAQR
jgi:hypothetical protein